MSSEMRRWIVVTGNPVDGFRYIGPFDSKEAACEYACLDDSVNLDWWVAELEQP